MNKKHQHKGEWKPVTKKLPWLLIAPATYALTLLAERYPELVEKLYFPVYSYISAGVGFIASYARGVSAAEILIYCTIASVLVFLIVRVVQLISGRIRLARFANYFVSLCLTAAILFNLFYLMWGFNYMSPSLYERMELPVEDRPVEELETLCRKLTSDAKELRGEVSENEDGVFTLKDGYASYFVLIPSAYSALGETEELFSRRVYAAKPVLMSEGMSYTGIAGIFIPFTAEANVNVDQPALLVLSSAAHETAHYLGIAAEDEANFVSYLACISSPVPEIEYSGVMLALIHSMNELYSSDSDLYYSVRATYSDSMVRDLADYNAYWDSFDGPVEDIVTNVNDNYLKFNRQDNGVKSYGMMVDLLLAYYSD